MVAVVGNAEGLGPDGSSSHASRGGPLSALRRATLWLRGIRGFRGLESEGRNQARRYRCPGRRCDGHRPVVQFGKVNESQDAALVNRSGIRD